MGTHASQTGGRPEMVQGEVISWSVDWSAKYTSGKIWVRNTLTTHISQIDYHPHFFTRTQNSPDFGSFVENVVSKFKFMGRGCALAGARRGIKDFIYMKCKDVLLFRKAVPRKS